MAQTLTQNTAWPMPAAVWVTVVFFVLTPSVFWVDSPYFAHHYFDGRALASAMTVLFFVLQYYVSSQRLKNLMLIMVPLSYIGELLFCKVLHMYDYRLGNIPLYVPVGHAVIYASGYTLAHLKPVLKTDKPVRQFFIPAFVLLFAGVAVIYGDYFSLLSGILFFLLMHRKKWQNLYFFVAVCVIYVELAGTFLGCWTWSPKMFGLLHTTNPPMGAVFFYAGGDVLLDKIVRAFEKRKAVKYGI